MIEGGKAAGVRLKGGDVIRAEHAVVANVPVWSLPKLLPDQVRFVNTCMYIFVMHTNIHTVKVHTRTQSR